MKKQLNKIVQWEKYIGIGGFFKFLFTFFTDYNPPETPPLILAFQYLFIRDF